MINKYNINDEIIGKGSFSTVYKGININNKKEYALKVIKLNSLNTIIRSKIKLEIDILNRISHPNIIKLYDNFYNDNKLYLVFDICKHHLEKELNNNYHLIKKNQKIEWINQLSLGLIYLHNNNIIHRDIKLQNVLLTHDNNIKIIDFGFARYFESDDLIDTICGSPLYMSPELFSKNAYDYKSDYWSMGIVLYNILVGKMPYDAKNIIDLSLKLKNITDIKIPSNVNNLYNSDLINLVESMLIISKKYRINIEELNNHPFITNKQINVNMVGYTMDIESPIYNISKPIHINNAFCNRNLLIDSYYIKNSI